MMSDDAVARSRR